MYFSLAKFQLVSCNPSLAMFWQMTYTHKLPKLCSATLSSLVAKQQPCTCITLLRKFLQLPLLHDYDVKIFNFTFCVNTRQRSLFSSPEFRYSPSVFNTRKICQRIERDGINAVNFKVAPTPTKKPTKNCQTDA